MLNLYKSPLICVAMNTIANTTQRRKGLFLLGFHVILLRKISIGSEDVTEEEAMKNHCLLAHIHLAFLAQDHKSRMVLLTVGWAFLHQSTIKTISHRLGHRLIRSRKFFSWGSVFPASHLGCVKLTLKCDQDRKKTYNKWSLQDWRLLLGVPVNECLENVRVWDIGR